MKVILTAGTVVVIFGQDVIALARRFRRYGKP
jgi:hypothetical protein